MFWGEATPHELGGPSSDSPTPVVALPLGRLTPLLPPLPPPPPTPILRAAVIRHSKQLAYEKLPSNSEKNKALPNNAMAAAAFDAPDFISGTVRGGD